MGKKFLSLIDRHFPAGSKLRKIFNSNTIKVSYSCMPNIGNITTTPTFSSSTAREAQKAKKGLAIAVNRSLAPGKATHLFRQISFQDGETCDHFVVRLRQQARHCDFGQAVDDFIRDQLIDKVPNAGLKKKLLEERNITLKRALEVTRTWEAAWEQASWMSLASPSINVIRSSSRRADHTREQQSAKEDRECFNCGRRELTFLKI